MTGKADILVTGTGNFAARIVFDIAATAARPITVAIAGRNRERREWLRLAANARAANFGRPASFVDLPVNFSSAETVAEAIGPVAPRVTVQAASVQSPGVGHASDTKWGAMILHGGLSVTVAFQALLSARCGQALQMLGGKGAFINCCFPDVGNGVLKAAGLPVTCGVGNVAILATIFAGDLGIREEGRLRVLAQHQNLGPWRGPPAERNSPPPRLWLDGDEMDDVYRRFAHLRLPRAPAIDISGSNGVPIILALATGGTCRSHAPGPEGLPGGYPVAVDRGVLSLDLPDGLTRDAAVAWNYAYEIENGVTVEDGRVRFHGKPYEGLKTVSPELAKGFPVTEIEAVSKEMETLRATLGG